ncbi:nucleotidyl transferase AbiEii/AbiGii toxin family protein [archaeon]|nr:nucleotidyl transferase AbiEii/AbiGii toxin family protein [archaeon]
MAKITLISKSELKYVAGKTGFNLIYLEKDYFLTILLYLLRDVGGIYFKGGTALNKIFLNHTRLSEDLDFTCTENLEKIREEILEILKENKNIFPRHKFENQTPSFFRLKIFYKSDFSKNSYVVLDVNSKASVHNKPEEKTVPHFYETIPAFKVKTISPEELVAEKLRAMLTRNQPRDYYDVYNLLKKGYTIDRSLLRKKLSEAGESFDVNRIFKNARKIYSKWDEDINHLTNKPVEYSTVITTLQKEFDYKNK